MAIAINGINHYAITVGNLEESVAWYNRVFGFEEISRGMIGNTPVQVSHMQGPGFQLEIFCYDGAEPLAEFRKNPGADMVVQGNKHVAFGVPSVRTVADELREMGVNIAHMMDEPGHGVIFINDNTGNLVELFQES